MKKLLNKLNHVQGALVAFITGIGAMAAFIGFIIVIGTIFKNL